MHRLRCFGRLVIEDEQGERVQLRSRKHLALLLYLAAHRDRRHDRERVARLFWDTEVSLARHSLSQALYDLRQHVPDLELDRTNREVGLGPNGLTYEGRDLEDAVREDQLGRAVRIYDGPFAPDLETVGGPDFERWVERERTRFRSLAEKALLRRVSECADDGRWGEMVVAGNRLVDMNPLNEEAHRAVIRGLWLQGDRGAALAHFDENEEFLLRELPGGLAPETRELVQKIRSSDRSREAQSVRERPRAEMVGREKEFRVLRDALADVMEGQSRFIVVRGEAGIGKTRLLEEFAEVAALEDVRLLKSRCYAAESDVPYGPIVDGLRDLAQEVADAADEEGQNYYQLGHLFPEAFGEPERHSEAPEIVQDGGKQRLFSEIKNMVTNQATTVWLVDDYQWIDQSSSSVLRYLAYRTEKTGLLVVVSTRPHATATETKTAGDKHFWSIAPTDLGLETLDLQSLTQRHTEKIFRQSYGEKLAGMSDSEIRKEVERLHSLSGGNPYFITQFCQQAEQDYPDSQSSDHYPISDEMKQVLMGRYRLLADRERQLLETVAVASRHAYPNVLKRIGELSDLEFLASVRQLDETGLIKDNFDQLEFSHEIARNLVYGHLSELRRSSLHASVGLVLEELDRDIESATLAHHFNAGRADKKAFNYAISAAREAEKRYAHTEAASVGRLALDSASTTKETSEALQVLYRAELSAGLLDSAERHLQSYLNTSVKDQTRVLEARISLLHLYVEQCRWDEAITQIRLLFDDFPDVEDDSDMALKKVRFLHLALRAAIRGFDHSTVEPIVREIKEMVELCDRRKTLRPVGDIAKTSLAGYINRYESSEAAWKLLSNVTVHQNGRLLAIPEQKLDFYILKGVVAIRTGRWDAAKHNLNQTLKLANERNDINRMIVAANNMAAYHLSLGNWEKVKTWYQKADDLSSSGKASTYGRLLGKLNYGESLIYQERVDEGKSECQKVLDLSRKVGGWDSQIRVEATLGLVELAQHEEELAAERWQRIAASPEWGLQSQQGKFKPLWLEGALRWLRGDREVWEYLWRKGEEESKFECAESLHILWLAVLLRSVDKGLGLDEDEIWDSEVARRHRELELTWFLYYGRRWVRRALL